MPLNTSNGLSYFAAIIIVLMKRDDSTIIFVKYDFQANRDLFLKFIHFITFKK
jgi:hypothetical protein